MFFSRPRGHTAWVNCVRFSQDGKRIVSGSEDATIKVWDADTGLETLSLTGHSQTRKAKGDAAQKAKGKKQKLLCGNRESTKCAQG